MKNKHYIRLIQDYCCIYQITDDLCDYESTADEVSNTDPTNGPMFCIVVPGLYDWHIQYENATDFAELTVDPDFDWAGWHVNGLLFAKEIHRQLPRDYTLIYDHPFEDTSGLIDKVNMETDDVDSIIAELKNNRDFVFPIKSKDIVDCKLVRHLGILEATFIKNKETISVRFKEDKNAMIQLRKWLETIVKARDNAAGDFSPIPEHRIEFDFFCQHIGGHPEMGQFWVRQEGSSFPIFNAYVDRREFVKTVYLSFMTKMGFYRYGRNDGAEELSASDKYRKYFQPYNELKSDIIEWFITYELYFNKPMPLDEGAHCVTEPLVMYNDYGHAFIWNSRDACCNHEDECIYLDEKDIKINVPGLLEWTDEYDSIEEIEDFDAFWDDGWTLAKKLRRQLPQTVDLYYMSFNPSNPHAKIDYTCRLPKIIVPRIECDEAAEQLKRKCKKAEPYIPIFERASIEEMKMEAISRMKAVIAYEPIIEDFSENDNPEVYEPPYGCCYSLEKEDKEFVKKIQEKEKILIWGAVREFKNLDDYNDVRDSYLFISENKVHWEEERKALGNMRPEAIIVNRNDKPKYEKREIHIYRSQGGTILIDE